MAALEPRDPATDSIARFLAPLVRLPVEWVRAIVGGFLVRWPQADILRRNGFRTAVVVVLGLGALAWREEVHVPTVSRHDVVRLLHEHCWVTYDPRDLDPLLHAEVSSASIRDDLAHIRAAGFTGIVTFGSRGGLARIPRIAKAQRLAVIMGVWSPGDVGEIRNAIAQRDFADAYCVGHDGLGQRGGYEIEELRRAIALVKRRTHRPVSTSEEVRLYEDPALQRLGDWLFPDIHVSLLNAAARSVPEDPEQGFQSIVQLARRISAIAAQTDRPLMLKMVTFPWQGTANASALGQRESFARFLEELRSPERGSAVRPAIVIHSAFDLPWKTDDPFYPWDPYTGVLDADGAARPAARAIAALCP